MGELLSLTDHLARARRGGGNKRGTRETFGNVRRLPSGRFQARYTAPTGETVKAPVTFDTKGDARTWLSMESAAITEHRWRPGPPPEPSKVNFGTFAKAWLADRDLADRTRSEYAKLIAKLNQTFENELLVNITTDQVTRWWLAQDADKPSARAHAFGVLHGILATAANPVDCRPVLIRANVTLPPDKVALISENPARKPKESRRTKAKASLDTVKRVRRPATSDELSTIRAELPDRYRALLDVCAWLGLRFGEATALTRADIDLAAGKLYVDKAVTWPNAHEPTVGDPKSEAGSRAAFIHSKLVPRLKRHLELYVGPLPTDLVFPNTNGGYLHHGSLYKVFSRARKAAKRPDLRWHDLRHGAATNAAVSGATTRELMTMFGHSTTKAAMVYQHEADERLRAIAEQVNSTIPDVEDS